MELQNKYKERLSEGLYIPSIEACWLYKFNKEMNDYIVDGKYLDKLLKGKLDFSFELLKDDDLINNIEIREFEGKLYSLDIVNVKFKKKYKGKYEEKTTKELRDWSYEKGFTFNGKLMSNWKRSSGKARVGQNLFLIDSIKDKCLDWARMGLKFEEKVDIGAIRAYESLPLSSIIGTIEINPKNILVIDDFESKFDWKMSKTWLEDGELKTETVITEESNSIWDGQGLLSNKIFEANEFIRGKGVALLRNRYMKCAGFCCCIEKFFKDYCEENSLDYNTFEVEDMYNNKIKVKDIMLITTPSAIKLCKYNNDKAIKESGFTGEGAWLKYWKKNCGNTFGVCKTEKSSHHCIEDEKGNIVTYRNVLSYQMVNTIPFKKDELKELVSPEIEYVNRLKNDLDFFLREINQLKDKSEEIDLEINEEEDDYTENNIEFGSNIDVAGAFIEMAKTNPEFTNTQVFKDYRRNFINSYVGNLRKGKIRVEGTDYCVACGNPFEMLMATVGKFYGKSLTLKENELYCSRFKDGEDVIGFRNPSINSGNIGIQVNKFSCEIHKYMNDVPNIVYLNSIEYPILSTYQGEDYDIDSNLLTNNKTIVAACKRIDKDEFSIPVNRIKNSGKNDRELTAKNMSDVDHIISQNYIGSVINLSQELNSKLNDAIYNNSLQIKEITDLYQMTSRLSSISQCEIDKAKKQFEELDVPSELGKMKSDMELVDNLEIRSLNNQIKKLKDKLKSVKKDVMSYRSLERKYYNREIRHIKEVLRINSLEPLEQDKIKELNDRVEELKHQLLNIAKDDIEQQKVLKKEMLKINKILRENQIQKLMDEKVSELTNELEIYDKVIEFIGLERQREIEEISERIAIKYKELSSCDSRRIKPLFFKYIGDNEAIKQRKSTNKKHKKALDDAAIEQFAKDNNIEVTEVNIKDKKLISLLKENEKIQKEWEDLVYRKLDTPMDWLQEEMNAVKTKNPVGSVQVIQLVKKNKHKANQEVVDYIVKNIKNSDKKIKAYRLDGDLSSKDKLDKIRSAKKDVVNNIKYMNPNKANMFGIMKECFNKVKKNGKVDKKTGIESISLEILFMAYGTGLLDMFCKWGDSKLKNAS